MSLKELSEKKKSEAGYGLALKVDEAVIDGDGVLIKGTALSSNKFAKAGEMLTVKGDEVALANMEGGGAKFTSAEAAAGTVLLIEKCKSLGTENGDRTVKAGYVTTITSNSKQYDTPQEPFQVATKAPVVAFKNPSPGEHEPKYIKHMTTKGKVTNFSGGEVHTFDREWVAGKIKETQKAKETVSVYVDAAYPERAAQVTTFKELAEQVSEMAQAPGNTLIHFRVYDDEQTRLASFEVRKTGDDYQPDVEGLLKHLEENPIFKSRGDVVENDKLFAWLQDGGGTMEVIPGERMYFPKKSAQSIIDKNITNPPVDSKGKTLIPATFIWGNKPGNYAQTIMSSMKLEGGARLPLNVIRDEPGHFNLATMPTAVTPEPPAANSHSAAGESDEDAAGADEAHEQTAPASSPSMG